MSVTVEMIPGIIEEAKAEAFKAADQFFNKELGGEDKLMCGFAWVNIYGIKMNTKIGKAFKASGITKDYSGALSMWNPSKYGCQNVDTLEAGAQAAATVFQKYGFRAYAGSRLD
jgi:hypothetical protein|tara:strand:+ start:119 stop:460 length:342 start_codon:yes stop_codon:yes gene_type:complete